MAVQLVEGDAKVGSLAAGDHGLPAAPGYDGLGGVVTPFQTEDEADFHDGRVESGPALGKFLGPRPYHGADFTSVRGNPCRNQVDPPSSTSS